MARTRIGASRVAALGIALLYLLVQCEIIHAKTYVVGGKKGWGLYPEMEDWSKGKNFKAGDVLVFNYNNTAEFKLAEVEKVSYEDCFVGYDPIKYDSGHDHVMLEEGGTYFVVMNLIHCMQGENRDSCTIS